MKIKEFIITEKRRRRRPRWAANELRQGVAEGIDPDTFEDLDARIIARTAKQIVPTARARRTPEGYVHVTTEDGLDLYIGAGVADGSISVNIGSGGGVTTSGAHKGAVTEIIRGVYDAAVRKYGEPDTPGELTIDHDAGHGVWQHIADKLGLTYAAVEVKESGVTERKKTKRKSRWAAYGPGPYGGYGFAAGYSGDGGIGEASYEGNIGMMEVAKFFRVANEAQKKPLKELMSKGKSKLAWKLIQDVTKTKLQGQEFTEDRTADVVFDTGEKRKVRYHLTNKDIVDTIIRYYLKQGLRVVKVDDEEIDWDQENIATESVDQIYNESNALPSVDIAKKNIPRILSRAQRDYDAWDENDRDTYAGGGICHIIADSVCDVLTNSGIECTPVSCSHEQHVYVAARFAEGIYTIDIPYHIYEQGGGFSWKKLPDVRFEPSDVVFYRVSGDPDDWRDYLDEGRIKDLDIDLQDQQWDSVVGRVQHGVRRGEDPDGMSLALYRWAGSEMFDIDAELERRGFDSVRDLRDHIRDHGGQYVPPEFDLDASGSIKDIERQPRQRPDDVAENFADGKVKGKSRPGRVKRAGVPSGASISRLRKIAKTSSGEKAKMAHWMANMKSGKKKTGKNQ